LTRARPSDQMSAGYPSDVRHLPGAGHRTRRRVMGLDIAALEGDGRGMRVRGDIDLATVDALERAVALLPQGPGPISIDGSEIGFIDSTGLRLLLRLAAAASDGEPSVVIVNPSPVVVHLFEVVLPGGVPGLRFEFDEDEGRGELRREGVTE
jgi:anti-sigma B factor antagonist